MTEGNHFEADACEDHQGQIAVRKHLRGANSVAMGQMRVQMRFIMYLRGVKESHFVHECLFPVNECHVVKELFRHDDAQNGKINTIVGLNVNPGLSQIGYQDIKNPIRY